MKKSSNWAQTQAASRAPTLLFPLPRAANTWVPGVELGRVAQSGYWEHIVGTLLWAPGYKNLWAAGRGHWPHLCPRGAEKSQMGLAGREEGHLGHSPGPLASPKLGRGSTVWVGVQEVGGAAPCILGSSGSVSRISGCARGCVQIDGESLAQSRGESGGQGQPWGSRGRALPARLSVILCSPGAQPCVSFLWPQCTHSPDPQLIWGSSSSPLPPLKGP